MLASLDDFKTYLGISWTDQDDLLTLLLVSASSTIEWYIWRNVEADDYTELIDWVAQPSYVLKQYPVNSVTSLEVNEWDLDTAVRTALDADQYDVDTDDWVIRFTSYMQRWFSNYKVVYNAGYATVPQDLQLACMQIAAWMYNTRQSNGISSESVAWDSISYDTEIKDSTFTILNRYTDVDF